MFGLGVGLVNKPRSLNGAEEVSAALSFNDMIYAVTQERCGCAFLRSPEFYSLKPDFLSVS